MYNCCRVRLQWVYQYDCSTERASDTRMMGIKSTRKRPPRADIQLALSMATSQCRHTYMQTGIALTLRHLGVLHRR